MNIEKIAKEHGFTIEKFKCDIDDNFSKHVEIVSSPDRIIIGYNSDNADLAMKIIEYTYNPTNKITQVDENREILYGKMQNMKSLSEYRIMRDYTDFAVRFAEFQEELEFWLKREGKIEKYPHQSKAAIPHTKKESKQRLKGIVASHEFEGLKPNRREIRWLKKLMYGKITEDDYDYHFNLMPDWRKRIYEEEHSIN